MTLVFISTPRIKKVESTPQIETINIKSSLASTTTGIGAGVKESKEIVNTHYKNVKDSAAVYKLTSAEKTLLMKLMISEAGSSTKGMALVGQVVMNRVEKYHSSVKSVIYAKGQFQVTRNGALQRARITPSAKKALDEIIMGKHKDFKAVYFCERSAYRGWFKTLDVVARHGSNIYMK